MSKKPFALLVVCLTCLPWLNNTYGQACPDPVPQTSGSHRFSRQGEIIDIPILLADCRPIALELRWSNGRNNGSNLKVTLLDINEQPIYVKHLSAFNSGRFEFPLATLEPRRWHGSQAMLVVPSSVTIEAIRPFAFPAAISYSVTRAAGPARRTAELDQGVAMRLQIAAGKLVSNGHSLLRGNAEAITYRLEEVQLPELRALEIRGRRETLEVAFRLILLGGQSLSEADLIWIDDAALPVFRRRADRTGAQEIGALVYDRWILRQGAEISVSEETGRRIHTIADPLTLPADFHTRVQPNVDDGEKPVEGNAVVSIHSAVRTVGSKRQPLVQIILKTGKPLPASDAALQLQIGRRIFLDELSGDQSGRRLTLTLTPEMFAELKQGAEIVAFFGKPDGSGFSDQKIWRFGRLNKEILDR